MKGRKGYLPAGIVDEIEDIKRENRVQKDSTALIQLVKYARVGREIERLKNLNWNNAVKRIPVEDLFKNGNR